MGQTSCAGKLRSFVTGPFSLSARFATTWRSAPSQPRACRSHWSNLYGSVRVLLWRTLSTRVYARAASRVWSAYRPLRSAEMADARVIDLFRRCDPIFVFHRVEPADYGPDRSRAFDTSLLGARPIPPREHAIVSVRFVRPWVPQPYYGAVFDGVTLGALMAATAVPTSPSVDLCWYWSNSSQTRRYWDFCQ